MPTLTARRKSLQNLLNMEFTDEYFGDLVFDFGLELDEVVEEDGEVVYKIDIPANRYDLLCTEGLCVALKAFLEIEEYEEMEVFEGDVVVHQVEGNERPYVSCAVVRDIDLKDEERYRSFMEYQDKLHLTIGRNRMLSSMGTHDLDKMQPPVFYRSSVPERIVFAPLNSREEMNGRELSQHFGPGTKIGKYMRMIENDERYVYFEDSQGRIMSLPPVINSDGTRVEHGTRNVFVEVTGTNFHRVNTMLKLFVGCFRGGQIESVKIIRGDKTTVTPVVHNRRFTLTTGEINKSLGLSLSGDVVERYLKKMMHKASVCGDGVEVKVHDVRSDVLHKCDIIEDVAVAHGFNNFPRHLPTTLTIGSEVPLNRFCDKVRTEFAVMGFNEALTLTLLSHNENVFDGELAVVLENPKSMGYEVARTSLVPGLLKFVASNLHAKAPFKVFEVADVVLLDKEHVCGARNRRRLSGVYAGTSAHLEDIQGPLSLLLEKCGIHSYSFQPSCNTSRYLENQSALVTVGTSILGSVGVCNPEICHLFKVPYAVSFFEVDVEKLFSIIRVE